MYLGARLFGICTYVLVLVTTLYLIRQRPRTRIKSTLMLMGAALVLMAFFFVPPPESDLYRLRIYSQNFAAMRWPHFLKALVHRSIGYSSTPLSSILMKLLGDLHISGLLSGVSCLIIFSIVLYILYTSTMDLRFSSAALAACLFWLMSADFYVPAISTIRSYLAASLVALAITRESRNGRIGPLEFIIYAAASLFHSIGIVLVCIRCAAFIFNRNLRFRTKFLCLLGMGICGVLFFRVYDDLIYRSFDKFVHYASDAHSYSYMWERIILMIAMLGEYRCYFLVRKTSFVHTPRVSRCYAVFRISLLIQTLTCFQFSVFQRLSFFTALTAIPLVLYCCRDVSGKHLWTVNFFSLSAVLMLLLTCARGYLCSLKFWL